MSKPIVFNYREYEELREAYKDLLADNNKLKADNRKLRANLEIANRILEDYKNEKDNRRQNK